MQSTTEYDGRFLQLVGAAVTLIPGVTSGKSVSYRSPWQVFCYLADMQATR
jgi:hypothetical protein